MSIIALDDKKDPLMLLRFTFKVPSLILQRWMPNSMRQSMLQEWSLYMPHCLLFSGAGSFMLLPIATVPPAISLSASMVRASLAEDISRYESHRFYVFAVECRDRLHLLLAALMRLMQAHHLEDPSHPRKQPIAAAVAAAIATTRHVLAVSLPQQGQGDVRLPGDPSNGQFWVRPQSTWLIQHVLQHRKQYQSSSSLYLYSEQLLRVNRTNADETRDQPFAMVYASIGSSLRLHPSASQSCAS